MPIINVITPQGLAFLFFALAVIPVTQVVNKKYIKDEYGVGNCQGG